MKWRWSDEVEKIGVDLLATVEDHAPLAQAHILWLFMDTVPMSSGRYVLGRARRVSGWAAFLSADPRDATVYETPDPYFTVEIAEQPWHHLRAHQKRALVDHELCHLKVDLDNDGPVLKMRGHDFEEFTAVIKRHGLWSTASQEGAMAMAEELAAALDDITTFVDNVGGPPSNVDPETGEFRDEGGE